MSDEPLTIEINGEPVTEDIAVAALTAALPLIEARIRFEIAEADRWVL